ncbi:MAG TPA: YicC/YloC family endoribonuclease [Acetobacteraceae bacterium]|nr:YicC/YloC family endoribonuclease [Acetobacteraceae bacterium]
MSSAVASMTGFARAEGGTDGLTWVWELRSVNGRGLDLRFRLPAGWDALEPTLREATGKALKRGNVSANLTARREATARLQVDQAALEQALTLTTELHRRIPGSPAPRAEALLSLPGVLKPAQSDDAIPDLAPVAAGFSAALAALIQARQAEGARLSQVIAGLLDEIAALHQQATAEAADQPAAQRARMLENLDNLLREAPRLPEERIAQEVALLATRSDVREELDRLASHIEAARALLGEAATIGRRFDFLVQELNREANTLCSKSASVALTATGLKLKAAIEQLREQVQNIE